MIQTFGLEDILGNLNRLEEIADTEPPSQVDVNYKVLFDPKAVRFLNSPDVVEGIAEYVDHYDKLVSESTILNHSFNHTRARSVLKVLNDTDFFLANHSVLLHSDGEKDEVKNEDTLKTRIEGEVERIFSDPDLLQAFRALDTKMSKTIQLQALRTYLQDHSYLVPLLRDLPGLKRRLWVSYLVANRESLADLAEAYRTSNKELKEIVAAARAEETAWHDVVRVFNSRFFVPFQVVASNQADVILKENTLQVKFVFQDSADQVETDNSKLLQVLSQGERRALYLLNVLFELRIRAERGSNVFVVVDDIADSFDYKNKYAIIEYLREVSENQHFRLLLLSHNFDFHRSVSGRLGVPRPNRWLASKSANRAIALNREKYQNNPFSHWIENGSDPVKYIASIPFVRNLADFCGHKSCFGVLTGALHLLAGTRDLTLQDIDSEFSKVIKDYQPPPTPVRSEKFLVILEQSTTAILARTSAHAELESKVVLSIAIRLGAEDYMIRRLANPIAVAAITRNQTRALLKLFKQSFPTDAAIPVLDQVQLMTPENIHLNSFMFEPILDLGMDHLTGLYRDIKAL